MDAHQLVAALKDLALQLGRTPTKAEFCSTIKGGNYKIEKFGNYTALVHAAGLDSYSDRQAKGIGSGKLTNEIFHRELPEVLEQHEPPLKIEQPKYQRILCIPDTHFPFEDKRVIEEAIKFAEENKPQMIIQVGDLFDLYCQSKFPRSQNLYAPKQEEDLAREAAEKMWKDLKAAAPNAMGIQLLGNHDFRALKRTLEALPSLEHVVKKHYEKLMTFDGVQTILDPRQEFILDGIEFIHGHYSGIGKHRDYALMNAVCGHIHVGGVSFKRIRGQTLWELNCGFAGDPTAKALSYTAQRITHWTPGFGYIDERGPRFIPV